MLSNSLPWQGIETGNHRQMHEKIKDMKIATSPEVTSPCPRSALETVRASFSQVLNRVLLINFRSFVVAIQRNLHLISTTAARWDSKTSQTICISRNCSEIFSFDKVGYFLLVTIYSIYENLNNVWYVSVEIIILRNYFSMCRFSIWLCLRLDDSSTLLQWLPVLRFYGEDVVEEPQQKSVDICLHDCKFSTCT